MKPNDYLLVLQYVNSKENDKVFAMKHDPEFRKQRSKEQVKARKKRHWKPHCRPVMIGNRRFNTIQAAADWYGCTTMELRKLIIDPATSAKYRYADGVIKTRVRKDSITIGDKRYKKLHEAAADLGYKSSRLCQIRKRLNLPE